MVLTRIFPILALSTALLSVASPAHATDRLQMTWGGGAALDQVVNFRGGLSSASDSSRPTMCLEVSPWGPLSMEACGTGAGFLHSDPGSEIAHFRTKWTAAAWKLESSNLKLQPGLGFAELQLMADDPGFQFGSSAAGGIETAGPEASLSLQWHHHLFSGFELVADFNLGVGWFQHAPELLVPQNEIQPFVDLTIGLGW